MVDFFSILEEELIMVLLDKVIVFLVLVIEIFKNIINLLEILKELKP